MSNNKQPSLIVNDLKLEDSMQGTITFVFENNKIKYHTIADYRIN
ncbi:hypothetical protein [uncultured Bacteroides sp.]|nr:hypothetical protein [uncultured Bacteroides sp.]